MLSKLALMLALAAPAATSITIDLPKATYQYTITLTRKGAPEPSTTNLLLIAETGAFMSNVARNRPRSSSHALPARAASSLRALTFSHERYPLPRCLQATPHA
jgi:hypothetical protein